MTLYSTSSDGRVWVYDDRGTNVAGPVAAIEAHDRYDMTLMDCAGCAAGEPMEHSFEPLGALLGVQGDDGSGCVVCASGGDCDDS